MPRQTAVRRCWKRVMSISGILIRAPHIPFGGQMQLLNEFNVNVTIIGSV